MFESVGEERFFFFFKSSFMSAATVFKCQHTVHLNCKMTLLTLFFVGVVSTNLYSLHFMHSQKIIWNMVRSFVPNSYWELK